MVRRRRSTPIGNPGFVAGAIMAAIWPREVTRTRVSRIIRAYRRRHWRTRRLSTKSSIPPQLNEGERVIGGVASAHREQLRDSRRPVGELPIWPRRRGNPESALRAGDLGLPLILANITRPPANFAGKSLAYGQRHSERGHDASTLKRA